ncbi:MAG: DNA-binding transcriptional LysR family regulator [Gammaproteobacteria bacterium]|jgi:DNA-binding transcriptional LysR family regulator
MELKWLEDLIVLLEEKSFTRAAVRQHVTQPAFSRRIRLLEEWLGVPIVDRSTKPIGLLPAAFALEDGIVDLLNRVYGLRHLALAETELRNPVTFIAQHTLAITTFPALISRIKRQFPNTSYRVLPADNNECEALFLKGAEFLLCYETTQRRFDFSRYSVEKLELNKDRLIPVCTAELAQRWSNGQPKNGDLIPLLLYQQQGFFGELLATSCLPPTMRDYRIEVICESAFSASLKEMCLASMGIAWLAGNMIEKELSAGRLLSLEKSLGSAALELVLYFRSSHATTAGLQIFDWLSYGGLRDS